jgi:hypothetical protein
VASDYCWRAAYALFRPGRPIRSAIDDFIENAQYLPTGSGLGQVQREEDERLVHLAVCVVLHAATLWAAEVK